MDNKRALVVVTKSYGNPEISEAIIRGTVSREMKMIQAERDLMRWCRSREQEAKIEATRAKYAPKHQSKLRTALEQVIGTMVLISQWRKEQRKVSA